MHGLPCNAMTTNSSHRNASHHQVVQSLSGGRHTGTPIQCSDGKNNANHHQHMHRKCRLAPFPPVPLWRSGAVSTTHPAGLPEPSATEEGLLVRDNNNAEQAVQDHMRSAEDSFVHHHYWSPGVVTGERQEEEEEEEEQSESYRVCLAVRIQGLPCHGACQPPPQSYRVCLAVDIQGLTCNGAVTANVSHHNASHHHSPTESVWLSTYRDSHATGQ